MINFKNITLSVHKQLLLQDANLHIMPNNKVVIQGPSGCGKSSLLKCAIGAIPINSGAVRIQNNTLTAKTAAKIRSQIAFIGQEPILGANSVLDALMLPFTYKSHRHNRPTENQIQKTLDQLLLPTSILKKPSNRISGGEKQRIAIARALLLNKTIFFTDEITSALDPKSKSAVIAKLFRPEITLLSISHDPDWISKCSRKIELKSHKLTEINYHGDAS